MTKNYLLAAALALTAVTASAQTQSFNYTGGIQTFTVPCGVDSIYIQAWGAQGGTGAQGGGPSDGGTGGLGGYAEGWLTVTPNEVLNIFVGGQGATPAGGFNGGGNGGTQDAGGGGGATDVRQGGTSPSNRVITAGGGGGGGRGGCHEDVGIGGNGGNGGSGGGGVGLNGFDSPQSSGVAGGGFGGNQGNVQGAGGNAGIGCGGFLGQPGVFTSSETGAAGGAGQACCCYQTNSVPGGGGGGGGQIGGGGGGGGSAGTTSCGGNSKGAGGGGGGGSSYIGGVMNGTVNNGIWLGNGMVTITYSVAMPSPANISGALTVTCAGGSDTLTFTTPMDPNATFYTWTVDPALNFISGQNTNTITVASTATAGTFAIVAQAVNGPCATSGTSDTIMVTVNALPSVTLNATPASFCLGGNATLSAADGSNTYTWNPGNQSGTSVTVTPSVSTTYTAVATNAAGCMDSSTVMVTVNQPPVVTMSSFSTICLADGPSTLTNGSPAGGVYAGPGVSGGNFDPGTAGIGTHSITYTYTDANGCTDSDSASVTVDACLGIAGQVAQGTIAVSPNPATDVVTIGWNANNTVTAVKIMDAAGRVVMTQTAINGNTLRLDVSALPAGTYTVSTEGSVKTVQTFVKK